jgi:hypothetical protein
MDHVGAEISGFSSVTGSQINQSINQSINDSSAYEKNRFEVSKMEHFALHRDKAQA